MSELEPCVIPWISLGTNTFGKPRPCGYSSEKGMTKLQKSTISREFNNELFRGVRLDFLNGKWPKNCERCRIMENSACELSKRQQESDRLPEVESLIARTQPDGSVDYFPKQIDIRLGSLCNLKCIHCGTGNSSKWMEDHQLINKYENTMDEEMDNRWVDRDTPLWREIFSNLDGIKKFNFLGGEPFLSKQHARFLDRAICSPFAKDIELSYVSNGTLIDKSLLEKLAKFKSIALNISFDATGTVLEFFRFPINAADLEESLSLMEAHCGGNFNLRLQWTCSNVSLFYLSKTLDHFVRRYSRFSFYFGNFVSFPSHMSPQNLPIEIKTEIREGLKKYISQFPQISFYLDYMDDAHLWPAKGGTFLSYVDDLSQARKTDWRLNLLSLHEALESHGYA